MEVNGQSQAPAALLMGKTLLPIEQEAAWAPTSNSVVTYNQCAGTTAIRPITETEHERKKYKRITKR